MLPILNRSRLLRELLTKKSEVYGIPATSRTLVLRRKAGTEFVYELIAPCSVIENTPESSPLNSNGRFSPYRVTYQVQGISRLRYPERTGLVGVDIDYLLNPQFIDGKWLGGTPLRIETFEESPTSWTITLSEKPAEQNLYHEYPV